MRVTYVLPYPELNGGNKVIFQHARLLADCGDEVTILGEGPRPDWIAAGTYHDYAAAAPPALPPQDLVIATYWTTVATARALALGPVAHFCQGYEGGLEHLEPQRAAIEAVYRLPLPTLTVTPHLASLLAERFGRSSRVVPPPLDRHFRPRFLRGLLGPRRRPWIAVPGIFEAPVKGVSTALAAVEALRQRGFECKLLRLSVLPMSDAERAVVEPERALVGVHPRQVARELSSCDLLLLASRDGEGFGLPVLEAMACGVPVVASSHPSLDEACGPAAVRADPLDAAAMAAAIEAAIERRDELVPLGLEHARSFTWLANGQAHLRAWEAAR